MGVAGVRDQLVLEVVIEAEFGTAGGDLGLRGLQLLERDADLGLEVVADRHRLQGVRVELEAVVADLDGGRLGEVLEGLLQMGVAQVAERAHDVAPDVDDNGLGGRAEGTGHQAHTPSTSQTSWVLSDPSMVRVAITGRVGVPTLSSELDSMVKKIAPNLTVASSSSRHVRACGIWRLAASKGLRHH